MTVEIAAVYGNGVATARADHPRVSVVIAAKDAGAFVANALRSALAQTMGNLEVIVVDDGSIDDTSDAVRACAAGDPRVLLLRNARSRGVSSARNRAIGEARGDWIAVLDADDEFAPDRLAMMIADAEARGLDLLADNLTVQDFDTKAPLGAAYPAALMDRPGLLTLVDLLENDVPGLDHWPIGCVKPIIRRSFLMAHRLAYREDVWCAEDHLLYAQSVLEGARFGVTDRAFYRYSARSGSVSQSATRPAVNVEVARVNRLIGELARRHSTAFDAIVRWRQTRLDYFAAVRLLKNGHYAQAGRAFLRVPLGYMAMSVTGTLRRRLRRSLGRY